MEYAVREVNELSLGNIIAAEIYEKLGIILDERSICVMGFRVVNCMTKFIEFTQLLWNNINSCYDAAALAINCFYLGFPGVIHMNNKKLFNIIALACVVSAVFLCEPVYGESRTEVFFDAPNSYYYMEKSTVWAISVLFCMVLSIVSMSYSYIVSRKRRREKAVMRNAELLRTLIAYTPDLILFRAPYGSSMEINDSTLELFGFEKEYREVIKQRRLDRMSPLYGQISENFSSLDAEAWKKGSILNSTEIITMPDGEKRAYDVMKFPVYYEDGRPKGLVILARDTNVYRQVQEKLERKEKLLRATLNATDDGILVVDNDRQVLEANNMYFSMWNIPWDIYDLNNETANIKFIMKQLSDPKSFEEWVNHTYEVPVSEHRQARLLDGRTVDVHSSPLMYKGHMIGRVWSFRDISAKVMAENELHISEESYRTLVELCPDAIFVIASGKIIFSNIAGVRILGAEKKEDIYQKKLADFMDKDAASLAQKHFGDIIKGKLKHCECNNRLLQLSGKSIEIEAACASIPYLGENAVVCIVRDISGNKNNEELKRRIDENIQLVNETLEYDKIRTEYFANISHEIKTPLNVIIGTLQLFELVINDKKADEGSERLLRYTSIMKQNGFRLLRMFNNLIYITEIDSGFIDMNYHNYNLVQVVKELLAASSGFIERKGAKLKTNIPLDSIEIACDADKIKRVLLNLLSNAIKFTEKGDEILVSLYSDKNAVYISVKDTGIGIEENMKDVIFERFRQVDKSFTRRCEGSGIGLYLAKSLTEMHGGTIEVYSEYGKGSEFIVKLPMWLVDDDESAATAEEAPSTYMDMASVEFSDIY